VIRLERRFHAHFYSKINTTLNPDAGRRQGFAKPDGGSVPVTSLVLDWSGRGESFRDAELPIILSLF
jgi:hypothetical protein